MPTVDELVDQVCRETGLDETTGSTERAIALSQINRAYRRICAEANRLIPSTATVTAALSIVLSTDVPTLVTLDSVYRVDGDRLLPLERTTPERLLAIRGVGEGAPSMYAVLHGELLLDAVETSDPSTLSLRFTARPTALLFQGSEASILGIDPIYHEDLLGTLGVAYVLEGNEGEESRAAYYRGLADETLKLFKRSLVREGGLYNARGSDSGRFDTPAPRSAR